MSELPRYIVVANAIIDREKIVWIDLDVDGPGIVTVHFSDGSTDTWERDSARMIWTSFSPEKDWRGD